MSEDASSLARGDTDGKRIRENASADTVSSVDELVALTRQTYRGARRLAVLLVGTTMVAVGAALLVLPGPGLLVVALGLSILATEFALARLWLRRLRRQLRALEVSARRLFDDDDDV